MQSLIFQKNSASLRSLGAPNGLFCLKYFSLRPYCS